VALVCAEVVVLGVRIEHRRFPIDSSGASGTSKVYGLSLGKRGEMYGFVLDLVWHQVGENRVVEVLVRTRVDFRYRFQTRRETITSSHNVYTHELHRARIRTEYNGQEIGLETCRTHYKVSVDYPYAPQLNVMIIIINSICRINP
jgi:hypothetical protein